MPTYEEALASDPSAFVECASAMSEAGTDLTEYQRDYNTRVAEINDGWQDRANAAFNEDVALVNTHVSGVVLGTSGASELLNTGGSEMVSQVKQLKALDAAYREAGFVVHPEPRVELGFSHWVRIVGAGLFALARYREFQAAAEKGTLALNAALAELNATDITTGTLLFMASERLDPLEDKGERIENEQPDGDERDEDRDDERDDDRPSGSGDDSGGDGDGSGGSDDDEKDEEDEEREEDERPEDRSPEEPEPEEQRPEERRPEDRRPEPETPEFPNSVPPSPPLYEADPPGLTTPDLPDYESSWDPAELTGDEELSGGLAGGGLGGGIGGGGDSLSADLPSGTGGGGGVGGLIGTPPGGASPTTAPTGGVRPGPGGMVGAPGSRGAATPDDGIERESFLVEDPEEDVWGIGTDEDSLYADHRASREEEERATPAPVDELPPFTLPGFDLPGTDRT